MLKAQPVGPRYAERPQGRRTRWAKTSSTLGPWAKVPLSAAVLAAGAGAYPLALAMNISTTSNPLVDEPAWVAKFAFGVIAVPACLRLLAWIWRRGEVAPADEVQERSSSASETQPSALVPWDQRPERFLPPPPEFSRIKGGPNSFSAVTKILVTVAVAFANLFLVPVILWGVTIPATFVLERELWRRERVK